MPRKPGSLNRITKETRELLAGVLEGEIENIQQALENLRNSKEEQYLNTLVKFLPYILPKAQESLHLDIENVPPPTWLDGSPIDNANE